MTLETFHRETFHIPAMDCPEEFRLIDKGLRGTPGIVDLRPDYLQRAVQVQFDGSRTSMGEIRDRLGQLGFPPRPTTATDQDRATNWRALCVLAGLIFLLLATALYFGSASTAWYAYAATLSAITAAAPVAIAAWRAIRVWRLDMNVLMVIAAAGALMIGEWFEAATAMTLFGIANWLERLSLRRASQAISSLANLLPQVAHLVRRGSLDGVVDHGQQQAHARGEAAAARKTPTTSEPGDIPVAEIRVGDVVMVRPGEHIPADGVVCQGSSTVTEAAVTGESLPIDKVIGDAVFAGSLNGQAVIQVAATVTAANSAVSQVGRLVEQARTKRSQAERFVDRFARYYTPTVMALAALVTLVVPILLALTNHQPFTSTFPEWFHRGLVLLVIACPCALVISTPITMVCGLQRAARAGILVKGGDRLELAAGVNTVALDKTGTLTVGHPVVVSVDPAGQRSPQQLLAMAAALDSGSNHPLARAIVAAAEEQNLTQPEVDEIHADLGSGITGHVGGHAVRMGTAGFAADGADEAARLAIDRAAQSIVQPGDLAVFVVADGRYMGAIRLADQIRPDAAEGLRQLRSLGVARIAMLSGDRQQAAQALAEQLEIVEVYAELLPAEKLLRLSQLSSQDSQLAMVGDGFNDAPALAAADLGIAMGQDASCMALESADVVVLSPQLRSIARLIRLARRTRQRLWQNIGLALLIKAVILLLTAVGYGSMWMAVAADVGASLIVIFNGMRLLNTNLEA